ncbi:hypothetical protein PspLS_04287 [Pyricularia sp. CBS 133598]|nr:hypothetical protein PspLS_04287 [Pyricularia sp. CBS 133598]
MASLLRFAKGQDKMFRMLVEVVVDSVFLVRRDFAYGAYSGHARIRSRIPRKLHYVRFRREGLQITSADGELPIRKPQVPRPLRGRRYLEQSPGDDNPARPWRRERHVGNKTNSPISVHDLAQSVSTTAVSVATQVKGDKIEIQKCGKLVDQDLIFDLKTRSDNKRAQLKEMMDAELQHLWVSRVKRFILAFHNRGLFHNIRPMDVKKQMDEWESANSDDLAKLAALVHRVVALARAQPDGKD